MSEWWINKFGRRVLLFFSPICEKTNIWDRTLKLQIVVPRYELIEMGWAKER
jgi:hypothetical protein